MGKSFHILAPFFLISSRREDAEGISSSWAETKSLFPCRLQGIAERSSAKAEGSPEL